MTLGARVKECRLALSWSQSDLAFRTGVKQQSIDQLESGRVQRPLYIVELSEALNVPLDWLRFGKGHLQLTQATKSNDDVAPGWVFTAESDNASAEETEKDHFDLNGQRFSLVPVYGSQTSAETEVLNAAKSPPLYYDVFRRDLLESLTTSTAESCVVMRVTGNFIDNTVQDGDFVLVDRAVTHCNKDGLYIIRCSDSGELTVMRLIRKPGSNLIVVKSDNSKYASQRNTKDDDLVIEGRVLWLSRSIS